MSIVKSTGESIVKSTVKSIAKSIVKSQHPLLPIDDASESGAEGAGDGAEGVAGIQTEVTSHPAQMPVQGTDLADQVGLGLRITMAAHFPAEIAGTLHRVPDDVGVLAALGIVEGDDSGIHS